MANVTSKTTMLVGTRKGLFILAPGKTGWSVREYCHSAVPVPYAVKDPRTGMLWASLDHGHWGAKLQRSPDGGKTWEEIEAPKYPKSARVKPWALGGKKTKKATLDYIWVITPGGEATRPMTESAVTDLPEPLSPMTPRHSPGFTASETPPTAR